MLDIHLNLSLEVIVVFESLLELEVNKKSVVIVESEEILLRLFVEIKLAFEGDGVTSVCDVRRAAVNAVTVLGRHKGINKYALLVITDLLRVVNAAAIVALMLILLNIYQDVIGEANVHECV